LLITATCAGDILRSGDWCALTLALSPGWRRHNAKAGPIFGGCSSSRAACGAPALTCFALGCSVSGAGAEPPTFRLSGPSRPARPVWLPWLVPVALAARSRVTAVGDTLTYRSPLRTRTWGRLEVEHFEIASGRWSSRARQIQMHAADGEWPPSRSRPYPGRGTWHRSAAGMPLWRAGASLTASPRACPGPN
jgi:hypothetical protein